MKRQTNLTLQYTFDVNHLRDPIGHKAFTGKDGRWLVVRNWIASDRRVGSIRDEVKRICWDHVKIAKGRWISVAFEDYHGKWISAALVEIIAQDLLVEGYKVATIHDWPK